MRQKITMAFLIGALIGQTFLGFARASGEAWSYEDVRHMIRLLEQIADNTRK